MPGDELQELFEAVREACPAGTWSRGVELARGGAVSTESEDAGEVVLRVEGRTGLPISVVEAPLRALVDEDLLLWDELGVRATALGRRFLDTVIGRLL